VPFLIPANPQFSTCGIRAIFVFHKIKLAIGKRMPLPSRSMKILILVSLFFPLIGQATTKAKVAG
jgi:hypothetical protein